MLMITLHRAIARGKPGGGLQLVVGWILAGQDSIPVRYHTEGYLTDGNPEAVLHRAIRVTRRKGGEWYLTGIELGWEETGPPKKNAHPGAVESWRTAIDSKKGKAGG